MTRPADLEIVDWPTMSIADAELLLDTSRSGLAADEVTARRAAFGPNTIGEDEPVAMWAVLLHQFQSPLVYILVIATVVTLAIGEYVDSAVIFAVLTLNAAIGFFQEHKAENAVRALMGLVAPRARVIRDGRDWIVESEELVPGDVVLLESGQRVPADLRLVSATALACDESLLTGESTPVRKTVDALAAGLGIGDRTNMAFTGSVVTSGRGRGVVVATGAATELGKIATQIREEAEPATPLQHRMNRFARVVGVVVAVAAIVTIPLGMFRGMSLSETFLVGVALAVSAIPEGLPVVFTITLAVGVQRMARRNAIIRRLPAVETLGSITVIGSDKTGTLTVNRMTVQSVWAAGREVHPDEGQIELSEPLYRTLLAGVLANEGQFIDGGTDEGVGDPTELALLVAAHQAGIDPEAERRRWESVEEIPFEPERRYSASYRTNGDDVLVFAKGAPERVLEMCVDIAGEDGVAPLDPGEIALQVERMASSGMRVLAMAYGPGDRGGSGDLGGLTFLGLQGMIDPPRRGVKEAIADCHRSGIRVVMITGDHVDTARAIAIDLGISTAGGAVVSGRDMDRMDDSDLLERVGHVNVFARVSPDHKLQVVRALQQRGEVVAVTGDGVNDAPALKAAEVGVAMGRSGTDVAREASDMVLADDDFVSIFEAVRQGRVTFDNLRKVTFFLISSGAAEIVVILSAVLAGWPLPMIPAQILWLNLVTNGVQDVALAFEPAERDVTDRPPRPPREGIISRLLWQRTVLSGVVMAAGTLTIFRWVLDSTGSLTQAQTAALTAMVVYQAIHAGNARSEHTSALRMSPFSNRFLLAAVVGALGIHFAALYLPFTQFVLRVEPLDATTWGVIVAMALSVLVAVEIDKAVRRRRGSVRTAG
jgi:calcium-translocating P-type ATPase